MCLSATMKIIGPSYKLIAGLSLWTLVISFFGISTLEKSISLDVSFHPPAFQAGKEMFRTCSSPESSVPWPFHPLEKFHRNPLSHITPTSPVSSSILNPHLKCGFGLDEFTREIGFLDYLSRWSKNRFLDYFETSVKRQIIQPILEQEGCEDLVVFGAALGPKYVKTLTDQVQEVDTETLTKLHGRCFFMFVQHDEDSGEKPIAKPLGHYWLVPLREKYLPYQSDRRNVKLLKYMGQYAFLNFDRIGNPIGRSPKHIIWQDAKFFRKTFVDSIPRDYNTILHQTSDSNSPCLTTMGLPISSATFGDAYLSTTSLGLGVSSYKRPRYRDHCKTIVDAVVRRPDVTDSIFALTEQCRMYMEYVNNQEKALHGDDEETDSFNLGLIDTAFIVWNESTKQCRDFNAKIRCTMLDQLQCHSDRDQVVFPLVIHQLLEPSTDTTATPIYGDSLKAIYYNTWEQKTKSIDANWIPQAHDLDFVRRTTTENNPQVYIRVLRSSCHWYSFELEPNRPMGERTCGHKIWLRENSEHKHPSLDQELQLASWSSDASGVDDSNAFATKTQSAVALARGNKDVIGAPYTANFHKCTSPEYNQIPWTFQEQNWDKAKPTGSCGTNKERLSPLFKKLQQTVVDKKIQPLANKEKCSDLVMFSVDFEKDINSYLSIMNNGLPKPSSSPNWVNQHGCFFLFISENKQSYKFSDFGFQPSPSEPLLWASSNQTVATGSASNLAAWDFWLVPIGDELLPYESTSRNTKLYQYSGQFFFPSAKNIIYQDVSFLSKRYVEWHPMDYEQFYAPVRHHGRESCLTVFSMPFVKSNLTAGSMELESAEGFFQGHCKHLMNNMDMLTSNGTLAGIYTDPTAVSILLQQCDAYIQYVYKRELETRFLDQGMVDTRFMNWNEGTEFCRDVNAKLRCTIIDQMHCHSENDSLVVPFSLYVNQIELGFTTEYEYKAEDGNITRGLIDYNFTKRNHDLYVLGEDETAVEKPKKSETVKIIREMHHWMNVSSCADDMSFRYKNSKQTCDWAGEKLKRCNWKHEEKRIRHFCPQTCNLCHSSSPYPTVAIAMATPRKVPKAGYQRRN